MLPLELNNRGMKTSFVDLIVYYQLRDSSQNHPVKQKEKGKKFETLKNE